jgi:outer membrane protein
MNNNKVLLAVNGILAVAVAVLFYLHFSSGKGGGEVSLASDTTVVNAKGKAVVYINTDSLMAQYDFSKKITADIEIKKTTMENTLKAKQDAFSRKFNEYKTKAEYLTPTERAKVEDDLGRMQMDGENSAVELQGKLQNDVALLNEQLFDKVEAFLKDYAQANGHTFILQYTRGISPILYGDAKLDITKDVVNKLNELYKKEQEEGTTEPAKDEKKK